MQEEIPANERRIVEMAELKVVEYVGDDIQEISEDVSVMSGLPIEEVQTMLKATIIKLMVRGKLILKKVDK